MNFKKNKKILKKDKKIKSQYDNLCKSTRGKDIVSEYFKNIHNKEYVDLSKILEKYEKKSKSEITVKEVELFFEKFIRSGSANELNISKEERNKLEKDIYSNSFNFIEFSRDKFHTEVKNHLPFILKTEKFIEYSKKKKNEIKKNKCVLL